MLGLRARAAVIAAAVLVALPLFGAAPVAAAGETYGIKCPYVIEEAGLARYVLLDTYTTTSTTYQTMPDNMHYVATTTATVKGKYMLQVNVPNNWGGWSVYNVSSSTKYHVCGSKVIKVFGGP
jgi:hypothetical protein